MLLPRKSMCPHGQSRTFIHLRAFQYLCIAHIMVFDIYSLLHFHLTISIIIFCVGCKNVHVISFQLQVLWWCCLCVEEDIYRREGPSSFFNNSTNFTLEGQWTPPAFGRINTSGEWDHWHIWTVWGAKMRYYYYSSVRSMSSHFFT